MKKPGDQFVLLAPAADGWQLRENAQSAARLFAGLAEAAAALPPGRPVCLALPCEALVIENFKLPATQREELAGMMQLQLEKNLPYPPSEASSDFLVLESGATESSVLAVTAPHSAIEKLCQPLRAAHRLPARVTPYVLHIAAACPVGETVLAIYAEQGQLVLALCADRRLAWAHVLPETGPELLAAVLPQVLLAATMEGAPAVFRRVLLAPDCQHLAGVLSGAFAQPIEPLPPAALELAVSMNLRPASWHDAERQATETRKLRGWLRALAAAYVVAALALGIYLTWLRREGARLEAQLATLRPQLELVQTRQKRSADLAPAIDPTRSTRELLFLLQRALPGDEVRITEFDQQLGQWRVTGEAPSATQAIEYLSRLKADPELAAYQITAAPPQLLPNEHAQFGIYGKR